MGQLELNTEVPQGQVELFALQDGDYPGDWFYRFQFFHPDTGPILRYDNAHDDDTLGWHHRHISFGDDSEIAFVGMSAHVSRFLLDLSSIIKGAITINDTDNTS